MQGSFRIAVIVFLCCLGGILSDAAAAGESVSLDLPVGRVHFEFASASAFKDIDAGAWWTDMSADERLATVAQVLPNTPSDSPPWPLHRIAAKRGLFHVVTIVVAAMERFFNHDYDNGLPETTTLGNSFSQPLNIIVYKSPDAMVKDATGWVGHEGKNAYFDPQKRQIGIVIDPAILPEMFPPGGSPSTEERAAQAFDAVRRTILIPFIHELVHALQQESDNVLFRSPFFAEGQATFLAQRAERTEVLFPIIAAQLVSQMEQAEGDSDRQEAIVAELIEMRQQIMKGEVKLIEEYTRLDHAKRWLADSKGQILGRTVCLSRRRFGIGVNAQRDYDVAWWFFQFLCSDGRAAEAQWFEDVLDLAKSLDWKARLNVTASIERRLLDYAESECPSDPQKVIVSFGAAVGIGDRLGIEGRHFDRYLLLINLARHDARGLLLVPYFGDFFLTMGQRDRFFFYYRDALQREALGHEANLSGRIRVVGHYIESLVSIGHMEAAAKIADKHSINSLDIQPLQAVCLRRKWFMECQNVNWHREKVAKLTREYELGFLLIGLQQLSTSETVAKALSERPDAEGDMKLYETLKKQAKFLKKRVRDSMAELGYQDFPEDAWFVLDFHIVDRPIDVKKLIENTEEPASR